MKQSASPSSSGQAENVKGNPPSKQELVEALSNMPRDLARGMSGPDVLVLQKVLVELGYLKGVTPNGNFGPATENAVVEFKMANNLATDRNNPMTKRVGLRTKNRLRDLLLNSNTPSVAPLHPAVSKPMAQVAQSVRAQTKVPTVVATTSLARSSKAVGVDVSSVAASVAQTPRQAEIAKDVIGQYDLSVARWARLKVDTKDIPSRDEVAAWLKSVPGEALEHLASYGPVRLKFIPPATTAQLAKSITKSKIFSEKKPVEIQNDRTWSVGSSVWEFGLTVDAKTKGLPMARHSDELKASEIFQQYERHFAKQGLDVMPQPAYLPSVIDARMRGIVFDDGSSSTLFKSLPGQEHEHLPAATYENGVILGGKDAGSAAPGSRCRPWIGRSKNISLSPDKDASASQQQPQSRWAALRAKFSGLGSRLSGLVSGRKSDRFSSTANSINDDAQKGSVRLAEQEISLLRQWLIAQYDSNIAVWKRFNLDMKGIPSKETVVRWLKSVPGEALEHLASYGPVRLKFIPPGKTSELLDSVNAHKFINAQKDSRIEYPSGSGWQNVGSDTWRFGLTVDVDRMPIDKNISKGLYWDFHANQKAFARYVEKFGKMGLGVMPPEAYVPSQVDCMSRGQMLDTCGPDGGTMFRDNLSAGFAINPRDFNIVLGHFPNIQYTFCRPWLEGR